MRHSESAFFFFDTNMKEISTKVVESLQHNKRHVCIIYGKLQPQKTNVIKTFDEIMFVPKAKLSTIFDRERSLERS